MDYIKMEHITEILFEKRDAEYAKFQAKLIPGLGEELFIGVRTPELRRMAKDLIKSGAAFTFMEELPHRYFDENQLHGFIISEIKDFDVCIKYLEEFLPYIDNWATCDQTAPKVFAKSKDKLLPYIYKWIEDQHTYTVRFAIGMLMSHYLDEDFSEEYVDLVSNIKSSEYYVNMEIAWYMATALAKKWDYVISRIEAKYMDKWVHNKTIQKAGESNRIAKEQKEYLKTLKK